MSYVIGVDVGGTFTDGVLHDDDGAVVAGKAPSTPPDYSRGVMDVLAVLAVLAEQIGETVEEMLAKTQHIAHGTTSSMNALLTGNVPPVGFLTTVGHRDSIYIMNVEGRYVGRSPDELQDVLRQDKRHALLPKRHALEVVERIDRDGNVVVKLDEAQAGTAIRQLVDDGVSAIAVSLLWSFRNPTHERRLRELIHEIAPDVFVSLSSEVSPRIREFSRNATTIMSTQIGPGLRHIVMDVMAAGYGARPTQDGMDTGGLACIGPGRHRGGLSGSVAIMPYGTEVPVGLVVASSGKAVSQNNGIAGGYPGNTAIGIIARGATVGAMFADGDVPDSLEALGGEHELRPCYEETVVGTNDVLYLHWQGGGGYGDPLLRDPDDVAADLSQGKVTVAGALEGYGVVLVDGQVDAAATAQHRDAERARRRDRSQETVEEAAPIVGGHGRGHGGCLPAVRAHSRRRGQPLPAAGPLRWPFSGGRPPGHLGSGSLRGLRRGLPAAVLPGLLDCDLLGDRPGRAPGPRPRHRQVAEPEQQPAITRRSSQSRPYSLATRSRLRPGGGNASLSSMMSIAPGMRPVCLKSSSRAYVEP